MIALLLAVPAHALDLFGSDKASSDETTSGATSSSEAGSAAALVVLGATVDDVQTPSTSADLAISLGGAFEDGALSDSYAIEVSPAWLGGVGKRLTLAKYAAGGWESVLWNSNLSLATLTDDDDVARSALAYRTTFWAAPPKKSATGAFLDAYAKAFADNRIVDVPADGDACVSTIGNLSRLALAVNQKVSASLPETAKVYDALGKWEAACAAVDPTRTPDAAALCTDFRTAEARGPRDRVADAALTKTIEALKASADAAMADQKAALDKTVKKTIADIAKNPSKYGTLGQYLSDVDGEEAFAGCEDILTDREGFLVDFALGAGVRSPGAVLEDTELDVVRLWFAPGYVREKWSLVGLARLSLEDLHTDTPVQTVDLGGGFGFHWARFTLTPEVLVRAPLANAEWEVHATVGGDVRVMQGVWFTLEAGGAWPADEPGSFVSFAGLTFGVERDRPTPLPDTNDLARKLP